jgi:hypothetical protein
VIDVADPGERRRADRDCKEPYMNMNTTARRVRLLVVTCALAIASITPASALATTTMKHHMKHHAMKHHSMKHHAMKHGG